LTDAFGVDLVDLALVEEHDLINAFFRSHGSEELN
jgi:hypothetical protein